MLHAGERMLVAALPERFEGLADHLGMLLGKHRASAILVSKAMRATTNCLTAGRRSPHVTSRACQKAPRSTKGPSGPARGQYRWD